ncbi:carbon monoxide dehydrogenase subunit G [Xanthobacter sp. KR7-65]|uniref:SRPBCC family protein n=1 Tax=Xanthobacter sp. KR7-65 TaxID=3156612 RepID=UPI0032B38EE7
MDMSGEQRIPAPREVVWQALNDPEILKLCIPGCQELVKSSDTQMSAKVVLKVGPVSARFEGAVTLCDLDPPNSYRIRGEGQGGMAGFAKGEAMVRLEADGDGTILRYEVEAQVGGKLAQLGARLIDATAKQMSGAFFKRFAQEIVARRDEGKADAGKADAPATSAMSGTASSAPPRATAALGALPAAAPAPEASPGAVRLAGLGIVAAALVASAYFLSGSMVDGQSGQLGTSPDFAGAVILILTASLGYLFGRLQGAVSTVVTIRHEAG